MEPPIQCAASLPAQAGVERPTCPYCAILASDVSATEGTQVPVAVAGPRSPSGSDIR